MTPILLKIGVMKLTAISAAIRAAFPAALSSHAIRAAFPAAIRAACPAAFPAAICGWITAESFSAAPDASVHARTAYVLRGLAFCIAMAELRYISVVIGLHLLAKDLGLGGRGLADQVPIQQAEDGVANLLELGPRLICMRQHSFLWRVFGNRAEPSYWSKQ